MSVKDPVCGMDVEPSATMPAEDYEGQMYYFCSDYCRAKFQQEPKRYVYPT